MYRNRTMSMVIKGDFALAHRKDGHLPCGISTSDGVQSSKGWLHPKSPPLDLLHWTALFYVYIHGKNWDSRQISNNQNFRRVELQLSYRYNFRSFFPLWLLPLFLPLPKALQNKTPSKEVVDFRRTPSFFFSSIPRTHLCGSQTQPSYIQEPGLFRFWVRWEA